MDNKKFVKAPLRFWSILAIPLLVAAGIFLYYVVWPSFYPPPVATTTIVAGIGLAVFLTIGTLLVAKFNKKFKS